MNYFTLKSSLLSSAQDETLDIARVIGAIIAQVSMINISSTVNDYYV